MFLTPPSAVTNPPPSVVVVFVCKVSGHQGLNNHEDCPYKVPNEFLFTSSFILPSLSKTPALVSNLFVSWYKQELAIPWHIIVLSDSEGCAIRSLALLYPSWIRVLRFPLFSELFFILSNLTCICGRVTIPVASSI